MRLCPSIGGDGRQAGVTLVELVVALTVVAMTLAAAVTAMRLLGRSGEQGTRLIARHEMLSRGVDAVRRDIERLQRVVRKQERDPEFAFYGDEKGLVFVVVEPPVPSEAGPYFILYSIVQGDDAGALVRSRAPYDASAKDIRTLRGQDDVTVLEGPYSFRFAYFNRKDGRERWLPRWQDRTRIPELIRLEVKVRGDGIELAPLLFRPRADAEQGCIRDTGSSCTLRTGGVLVPAPAAATPERKK